MTGRGGAFIIIDDPVKAADANSEVMRESAISWFRSTVVRRFNNPKKGRIVVVAQRLHMEDLPGLLLTQDGWHELRLPLVAERSAHQPKDPIGSKQDRASQHSSKLERGETWVPREAPWLTAFEDELASFPHGKHDDQVDSVIQFLAALDTGRLLQMVDQARRR